MNDFERAIRQLVKDWQSSGITHWEASKAVCGPDASPAQPTQSVPLSASVAATSVPPCAAPPEDSMPHGHMDTLASRDRRLKLLAAQVAQCARCEELAQRRKQTVFGVGNPLAEVMFIGEAPGAEEDEQGEPFVGRAGRLLNDIIKACGWTREELYICNILRCRPPGNRTPSKVEAQNCREYLDEQIAIVSPSYIVCWGSCAAGNLLDSTESIGKMRQRWYQYGKAKVLCTYHPSYLLRNPSAKKPVWEDMKFLLKEMGREPPPR